MSASNHTLLLHSLSRCSVVYTDITCRTNRTTTWNPNEIWQGTPNLGHYNGWVHAACSPAKYKLTERCTIYTPISVVQHYTSDLAWTSLDIPHLHNHGTHRWILHTYYIFPVGYGRRCFLDINIRQPTLTMLYVELLIDSKTTMYEELPAQNLKDNQSSF